MAKTKLAATSPADRLPIPGPGRPKGSKNKLPKERALAAIEAFAPINSKARELMERHLTFHLTAQEAIVTVLESGVAGDMLLTLAQLNDDLMRGNCATCRHIFTLSSEYVFGKPIQRIEMDEAFVQAICNEFPGIAPEQVRRDLAEQRKHIQAV